MNNSGRLDQETATGPLLAGPTHADARRGHRLRRVLSKLLPLLLGVFGTQAALLVTGILSARLLGAAGRGTLATAMLIPTLGAFLAGLAVAQVITVLTADGASPSQLVGVGLRTTAMPMALATISTFAVTYYSLQNSVAFAIVAAGSVPALVTQSILLGAINGMQSYWKTAAIQLAHPTTYAISVVAVAISNSVTPLVILVCWVLTLWVIVFASILFTRRSLRDHARPSRIRLSKRSLATRGAKSMISTYSPLETFRLDQIVVASIIGTTALGLYVVALSFSNMAKLLGQALSVAIASKTRTSEHDLRTSARQTGFVAVIIGFASAAILPPLVPLVFGQQFSQARLLTALLCIAAAGMAGKKVMNEALRALRLEHCAVRAEIASCVLFLFTVPVFIAYPHIELVAISLAASSLLGYVVMHRSIGSRGRKVAQ